MIKRSGFDAGEAKAAAAANPFAAFNFSTTTRREHSVTTDYQPKPGSKVDLAVSAIRNSNNKDVVWTSTNLAVLMDCSPANVKNNLKAAVKNGLLAYDPKTNIYTLGDGTPLSEPAEKAAEPELEEDSPELDAEPAVEDSFVVGYFSDGDLQIIQGENVMVITPAQQQVMKSFLNRIVGA